MAQRTSPKAIVYATAIVEYALRELIETAVTQANENEKRNRNPNHASRPRC